MDNITILEGNDLDRFLDTLGVHPSVRKHFHTLRINQREDGLALKVNSGVWSPTIGRRADSGGY